MAEIPQRLGVRQEPELGLRQCQGDLKKENIVKLSSNKIEKRNTKLNHENKTIWDFFRESNQCTMVRIHITGSENLFHLRTPVECL